MPTTFSIVIPTFNRAHDLATSLLAVRQLDPAVPFEVVVADDGSNDSTAEVIAEFEDLPLTYDWKPNEGVSSARNRGAALSSNDFLAFLDTGDEPFPDWLVTFGQLAEAYRASVVFCSCRAVGANGREWVMRTKPHGPIFNRMTANFVAGGFAVERRLFEQLGGYDPQLRYSEGTELGIRIAQALGPKTDRVAHAARPHLTKHVPEGSSHAYSNSNRYHSATYMLEKHADVFATDAKARALYERMAGVAAARMGDHRTARAHLLTAARLRPRDWTNVARAAAGVVPAVQQVVWPIQPPGPRPRPQSDGAPGTGPVFIVGAMRSGTTLLRLMLNEHPELAIPAESHFVAHLFRELGPTATLDGDGLRRALDIVTASEEWQRDYRGDAHDLEAAVGSAPVSVGDLVDRIFRFETAPTGKPRWGDKTPAYLFRVADLLACFDDSQIIAIVRDPRDAFLSLSAKGWVGESPWEIGHYLLRCDAEIARWTDEAPGNRFRVVRYEDLVLDTDRTLHDLCDFLGLDFADQMRSFFQTAERNVQDWELDIGAHNKLLRPPDPADVGRWRREGSRVALAELEAITAPVIARHGYERRTPTLFDPVLRSAARVHHRTGRQSSRAAAVKHKSVGPRVPE